jgi:glycerol-3-phosphate cytidylyltransferase
MTKQGKIIKVVTVGVFDLFHLGHMNVLEQASHCGDYLIIGVHDDMTNSKNVSFFYSLEDRIRFVSSLRFVSEALRYERIDLFLQSLDFDVFAHGPDQNHQYFQKAIEWCNDNNKKVVELQRTEGISSTILRDVLKDRKI